MKYKEDGKVEYEKGDWVYLSCEDSFNGLINEYVFLVNSVDTAKQCFQFSEYHDITDNLYKQEYGNFLFNFPGRTFRPATEKEVGAAFKMKTPSFEVGQWATIINLKGAQASYIDLDGEVGRAFRIKSITPCPGTPSQEWHSGDWETSGHIAGGSWLTKNIRPSTTKEIEFELMEEIKRRNYSNGTKITGIRFSKGVIGSAENYNWTMDCRGGFSYNIINDELEALDNYSNKNCTIYQKGVWVGIVGSDININIGPHKVEITEKGFIKVGCKEYSLSHAQVLLDTMKRLQILSVNIEGQNIYYITVKVIVDNYENLRKQSNIKYMG